MKFIRIFSFILLLFVTFSSVISMIFLSKNWQNISEKYGEKIEDSLGKNSEKIDENSEKIEENSPYQIISIHKDKQDNIVQKILYNTETELTYIFDYYWSLNGTAYECINIKETVFNKEGQNVADVLDQQEVEGTKIFYPCY